MRYWLQTKAPAGNWVDFMGSDDLQSVKDHANWHYDETGEQVRIVERTDVEITS